MKKFFGLAAIALLFVSTVAEAKCGRGRHRGRRARAQSCAAPAPVNYGGSCYGGSYSHAETTTYSPPQPIVVNYMPSTPTKVAPTPQAPF